MKTKMPLKFIGSLMFIIVFKINSIYSQNTLQIIKFEEAQEMFNSNKFKEAVTILTDLENKGLKNPKVLHLKILAKSSIDKKEFTPESFNDLKKDIDKYLKDYDLQGLEDKYKEVYEVSKKLKAIESFQVKKKADNFFNSKDYNKALELYLQSNEMGYYELDLYLPIIDIYKELSKTSNSYKSEVIVYHEKAADLGHIPSCIDMGHLYREGKEVSKDPLKAAKYFRKAEGSNLPGANIGMAWVHNYGVDGKYDHQQAIKLLFSETQVSKYFAEAHYIMLFTHDILDKILQNTQPSNHQDYYIRERAALMYLSRLKPNKLTHDNLAQEVYNSLKTGAEEFNSPLAQLYLHYIHKGIIHFNGGKKSNFKFEVNKTLAEKYLSDFNNNPQKKEIPYIQYLMAIDIRRYVMNINFKSQTNEVINLYDQSIGGGCYEAIQNLKYYAKFYGIAADVNILRKYNISY